MDLLHAYFTKTRVLIASSNGINMRIKRKPGFEPKPGFQRTQKIDRCSNQLLFDSQLDGFNPAVDAQLLENIRDVKLDCPQADDQLFGDLVVIQTFHHPLEDIPLPLGQFISLDVGLGAGIGKHLYRLLG